MKRLLEHSCLCVALLGWSLFLHPVLSAEEITTLETVIATGTQREIERVPASLSVISAARIQQQPINDLADIVSGTVGVSLQGLGNGRQGISLRGMEANHTLILVNGERISSSNSAIAHSDFELGWVPAEALDRVEIVRGPMSSLYGSEALGGVVNLVTRKATDIWEGSLSTYGLWNNHGLAGDQYKTGFYVGGPIVQNRLGINLWGETRLRQALREVGKPFYALDKQQANSAHLGLVFEIDAHQRVDASVSMNNEEQEGYKQGGIVRGRKTADYSLTHHVQRRRYSLAYQGDWEWGDVQLRAYRSTLKRDAFRTDNRDVGGPNKLVDNVIDGKLSFFANKMHQITLGGEYRRESLQDPAVNRVGKKVQTHYALFAQDEIFISDKFNAVLGARLDHHEAFGWELSPRAYLMYSPSESWTFKAGIGRGFKAPTLKQLSAEYESRSAMGGRGIIRGNPDLEPEKSLSYELGAQYDDGHFSAGIMLFRNEVKNLIETKRLSSCERGYTCLAYQNVNKALLQGVEFSTGVAFSEQWRLDGNYTYLSARNKTLNVPLEDRSRHQANLQLTWQPTEAFKTSLRAEYVGKQFQGDKIQPSYKLFHWYVNYDVNKNVSVRAGIENIANKRLALDDSRAFEKIETGRRYFAGLTARW